jgi:hypothetical protein
MSDWEQFFERYGNYSASLAECSQAFSLEELYQAFKARMEKEAREVAHPNPACPARQGPAEGCIC